MDFEFEKEMNLREDGIFMKVTREQFIWHMDIHGFKGYIHDGDYWINYKWLKLHAAEPR